MSNTEREAFEAAQPFCEWYEFEKCPDNAERYLNGEIQARWVGWQLARASTPQAPVVAPDGWKLVPVAAGREEREALEGKCGVDFLLAYTDWRRRAASPPPPAEPEDPGDVTTAYLTGFQKGADSVTLQAIMARTKPDGWIVDGVHFFLVQQLYRDGTVVPNQRPVYFGETPKPDAITQYYTDRANGAHAAKAP